MCSVALGGSKPLNLIPGEDDDQLQKCERPLNCLSYVPNTYTVPYMPVFHTHAVETISIQEDGAFKNK